MDSAECFNPVREEIKMRMMTETDEWAEKREGKGGDSYLANSTTSLTSSMGFPAIAHYLFGICRLLAGIVEIETGVEEPEE
jgi:hypothetical protein